MESFAATLEDLARQMTRRQEAGAAGPSSSAPAVVSAWACEQAGLSTQFEAACSAVQGCLDLAQLTGLPVQSMQQLGGAAAALLLGCTPRVLRPLDRPVPGAAPGSIRAVAGQAARESALEGSLLTMYALLVTLGDPGNGYGTALQAFATSQAPPAAFQAWLKLSIKCLAELLPGLQGTRLPWVRDCQC